MKKSFLVLLVLVFSLCLTAFAAADDGMNIMFVVTGSLGGGTNVDDVKAAKAGTVIEGFMPSGMSSS